jgi:hypothetical protein
MSGACPAILLDLVYVCSSKHLFVGTYLGNNIPGGTMDPRFQAILNALPEKQPRSRLEPYRQLIAEMRKRGRSYREITQVLTQSCGVRVGTSTINDFVLARSKSTMKHTSLAAAELVVTGKDKKGLIGTYKTKQDLEGVVSTPKALEGIRRKIKEVKDQPPQTCKKKLLFEYNPDEPLRLQRNQKTRE